MATKTPNPTPNEPNRPAVSRAKAKADAGDSKSAPARPKGVAAKPKAASAPKAKSVAPPKPAKTTAAASDASKTRKATAPKAAHAKPAASKERPHSSEASRMASRKTSARKSSAAKADGREASPGIQTVQPDATAFENHVVKTLFDSLEAHVAANELGHVVGPKQFDLGSSEPTGRLPDIAFVSFERWAQYRRVPTHDRWHVAPDLLVQIVREGELAEDFTFQLDDCFNAGVRRVWLLFPDKGEARVYESATDVQTLGDDQTIEGGDVLPGYEHLLVMLFREPQAGE